MSLLELRDRLCNPPIILEKDPYRVKFAVSLFDHGIDSVKNVAALSGFSDPLYFSSVFKKSIGCSPSDYREQSHGGDEA